MQILNFSSFSSIIVENLLELEVIVLILFLYNYMVYSFYLFCCLHSSGMTCPAADFVEESFLLTAKNALSEQGLFIVNLVSRSQAIKDMVVSRMKKVRISMVYFNVSCPAGLSKYKMLNHWSA